MILFEDGKLTVRSLTDQDAKLLVKWLSDPQVLQYYEGRDRPHDYELVIKHFYNRTREITQCIVQYDDNDIGYLQFYPLTKDERLEYGYPESSEKIYGMDQFIGEVTYWNKGIGSQLVKSTVDFLIDQDNVAMIVMDPQSWNHRALRCYEKCGFKKKRLLPMHELHEGERRDCWLIELEARHKL